MKKYLTKSLQFILFASVFYILAVIVWGRFMPSKFKPNLNYKIGSYGHLYSRIKEIDNLNKTDILFLGSSHTYRGFDIRIFKENGISSFNLGSSSQTPLQTMVLLKRYLKKINPELIIYEVYPETFSIDGVESSLDIIANDRNDILSLKMAFDINNMKVYNTLIYGAARDLFNMNSTFIEPKETANDTYIPGGFVERKMQYFDPVDLPDKKWDLNEKQFTEFKNILELLKSTGIEVILVYAPVSPSLYKSYTNNSEFDRVMSGYSKYYNFNEILHLNDSLHFYDSHHLNQNGVKIFNDKLIEIIKQE